MPDTAVSTRRSTDKSTGRLSRFSLHCAHPRSRLPARTLRDALRQLRTVPGVGVMRAVTMTEALGESIQTRRFRAWLFGGFAFAALGVAGIGILGMTLMSTARRTREMGLRFALGATRAAVIGGLLREQMTAVVIGLLGGGIVAAWSVRLLKSYLYQFTRRTRASGPSPWRPSR